MCLLLRGLLALMAGWWCAASVWAHEPAFELSTAPGQVDLLGHLALLSDAAASLDPRQALAHPGWQPATVRDLNPGVTAAALWLRLELSNDGSEESTRWLSLGNPRLEHVDLYRVDGDRLSEPQRAGVAHPPPVPLARGMDAVFELTLAPGARALVLLRVHGRTSLVMQPELWSPLTYLKQGAVDELHYLLPIGVTVGLVLYLLASTLGRSNLLLALLGLWLFVGVIYDFAFQGQLRRYLMPDGGDLAARLPVLFGLLVNVMLCIYLCVYLELKKRRGWWLFFGGVLAVLGVLVLASLFGPLRAVVALSSVVLSLFFLIWPFVLIQPWREGVPYVRVFVLAMACVWIFTAARMSNYAGYWHLSGLTALYVAVLFKLLLAFVLLYAVTRHSIAKSRAILTMQAELLEAQRMEQERLEEAVDVRSAALRQAAVDADEAVRAKGELLARVGHDLRAPLSAIMAYAARLEAAGGAVRQRALVIARSAREQLALINGLIEYARAGVQPDAVLPQPLYLEAWLRSIESQATQLALRHASRFEFSVEGRLPEVVVLDAKRVRQVLLLLLTHAAERASPGQVGLRITAPPEDGAGSACLLFTVCDDGPAIPADLLPTLFQPCLRLGMEQKPQEAGLGLAIASQWAERMGGSLQALPGLACGATLRLVLPLVQAREADIVPRHLLRQEARLPELSGAGRHLWLAEDSLAMRELLVNELSALGFEVTALADGRAVLNLLDAEQNRAPDLLLTDLIMPGADGLEVLRGARARWPELPVMLLTATPAAVADQPHGFSAILAKPVSLAALRTTLAALLGLALDEPAPPRSSP